MTTLYRPVLIESAEQAEALPVGTVAYGPETGGLVGIRAPESSYFPWHCSFEHDPTAYSSEVVGWTALVPIEAEEETSVVVSASGFRDIATHPYSEASMDSDGNVWFGEGLSRVDVTDQFNEWAKQHTRRRYVTPWEEA